MKLSTITKLAAVAATSMAAYAGTITYDITGDHATGGLGTAPFGTVTLTEVGANTTVNVHLVTGYKFVTTGAADDMYFKFNAVGIVVGDISVTTAGMNANTGNFNGDGTGMLHYGIDPNPDHNGINAFTGDINFTVSGATISDLTSVDNILKGTGENVIFVADLLSPNGNTGPAYVVKTGGSTNVPDGGATVALLGVGMLGLGALRRKL